MIRQSIAVAACVLSAPPIAAAQEPYNLTAPVKNLATLFTDLYGPNGLIVDSEATLPGEQPHSAHFNSDFQSNFSQFGTALVGQLVTVPLPSPASGFTYQLDRRDRQSVHHVRHHGRDGSVRRIGGRSDRRHEPEGGL